VHLVIGLWEEDHGAFHDQLRRLLASGGRNLAALAALRNLVSLNNSFAVHNDELRGILQDDCLFYGDRLVQHRVLEERGRTTEVLHGTVSVVHPEVLILACDLLVQEPNCGIPQAKQRWSKHLLVLPVLVPEGDGLSLLDGALSEFNALYVTLATEINAHGDLASGKDGARTTSNL